MTAIFKKTYLEFYLPNNYILYQDGKNGNNYTNLIQIDPTNSVSKAIKYTFNLLLF